MNTIIYYKTAKSSATGNKLQALITKGAQVAKQTKQLCQELGASEQYLKSSHYVFGTGVVGFQFATEPDLKIWKKIKRHEGFYAPRMGDKTGKEIGAKMAQLEKIARDEIGKCIGFDSFFVQPSFIVGLSHFAFGLYAEWEHTMPEDCIEITASEFITIKNEIELCKK